MAILRARTVPASPGAGQTTRSATAATRHAPPGGPVSDMPVPGWPIAALERAVERAAASLRARQRPDGHWVFDLEADATLPAEYLVLRRFLGRPDAEREARIALHLRRLQNPDGGWSLFHGGRIDVSASVKAYLALRTAGDAAEAPHMRRARAAIHAAGGAEKSNVFTRALLAMLGEVPWRAVPAMPPEIMLLPRWFPFHLSRISYWARTVVVPLTVVMARRPVGDVACAPIQELFLTPPEQVRRWPGGDHESQPWASVFRAVDRALHATQRRFPRQTRARAEAAAMRFVNERLNGEDGLGAIYPAMANALVMYRCLGVPDEDPRVAIAWEAVEKLVLHKGDETTVQPCLSPVWDTALAAHALMEAADPDSAAAAARGLDWLVPRQVTDVVGDWAEMRPNVRPGGWAFQYANPHYPDLDDTAVVVLGLDRARSAQNWGGAPGPERGQGRERTPDTAGLGPDRGGAPPTPSAAAIEACIDRAVEWVAGLQSRDGGWGAFDADNTAHHLNHIPFADHGALLDPPTADVTARCLGMLAQLGRLPANDPVAARGLRALLAMQEPDGSWFGRWGVNYIYGTWSALCGLNAVGTPHAAPPVRRAVAWLLAHQNPDGGWGESGASYALHDRPEGGDSTASQTAWALLGLMAAGEADHPALDAGLRWLADHQTPEGGWREEDHTGTGFPRVFYLRYGGYAQIFPLWALARARNLRRGNSRRVAFGL